MKPVTSGVEPAVLTTFRAANPAGTWSEFKHEPGNEAVFDALARAQGFICAYCEMDIRRPIYGQVEHFEPKSQSTTDRNLHLEFQNLLACCEGGTTSWNEERTLPPIQDTMHCGALKGETPPTGRMLDPRRLSAAARIWMVSTLGHLSVDHAACLAEGIASELAEATLTLLGLNRRVLVRRRAETMKFLDQDALSGGEGGDLARILQVAAEQLLAGADGRLPAFWSTIRAWAGPDIEPFILDHLDDIPGLSVVQPG